MSLIIAYSPLMFYQKTFLVKLSFTKRNQPLFWSRFRNQLDTNKSDYVQAH